MKRAKLNFIIDGLAFAAFLFLMSTGLLLRYQLPVGSGGLHGGGAGSGAGARPIALLWGMTRHEWGEIHYWIAAFLITVLTVHIVLHWKWIACVVKGTQSNASGLRFGLGFASLLALLFLAAVPVVVSTDKVSRSQLQQQRSNVKRADSPESEIELRGSMTVAEVATAAGMSVDDLVGRLNFSGDVSPNDPIGRTLRRNEMRMSDLRQTLGTSAAKQTQEQLLR
jgi:hypothetical protein